MSKSAIARIQETERKTAAAVATAQAEAATHGDDQSTQETALLHLRREVSNILSEIERGIAKDGTLRSKLVVALLKGSIGHTLSEYRGNDMSSKGFVAHVRDVLAPVLGIAWGKEGSRVQQAAVKSAAYVVTWLVRTDCFTPDHDKKSNEPRYSDSNGKLYINKAGYTSARRGSDSKDDRLSVSFSEAEKLAREYFTKSGEDRKERRDPLTNKVSELLALIQKGNNGTAFVSAADIPATARASLLVLCDTITPWAAVFRANIAAEMQGKTAPAVTEVKAA